MATRKTGTRATNAGNGAPAPAGYRKVETGIAGFWRPRELGDEIEGIVGERCEGKGADGRAVVYFRMRLADDQCERIETDEGKRVKASAGLVVGIGGAVLRTFLGERQGHAVLIRYAGMGEARKGKNAPKLFDCYEQDTPAEP